MKNSSFDGSSKIRVKTTRYHSCTPDGVSEVILLETTYPVKLKFLSLGAFSAVTSGIRV